MLSKFVTRELKDLLDKYREQQITNTIIHNYILRNKDKSRYILPYLNYLDNKYNTCEYLDLYNNALELNEDNYSRIKIRSDYDFKNDVKKLANYKCQITNTHLKGCEVAHILDFQYCEYNSDKYSAYNGLLLKTQIHKYWDADYIKLEFDVKNNTIFFVLNNDKIELEDNSDILLMNIRYELSNNLYSDKYYLNFCKDNFNEYKYYISARNDFH